MGVELQNVSSRRGPNILFREVRSWCLNLQADIPGHRSLELYDLCPFEFETKVVFSFLKLADCWIAAGYLIYAPGTP